MGWKYGWYYDTVDNYYYGATVTGILYGSYEYGAYGWDNVFSFTGAYSWGWGWHLDYGWEYEYFTGSGYYDLTITGYFADGWNSMYGTFEQEGRGIVTFDEYTPYSSWDYGYYYDFDTWFTGSFSTNYDEYSFSYVGDITVTYQGWLYGWYYDWWYYDSWSYGSWWYDMWGWFGWSYGWYYDHGWHYGWSYGW